MTWSRVILIVWTVLTLAVAGIYARTLHGFSTIGLGRLSVSLDSTVRLSWHEKSLGYYLHTMSWNDLNSIRWSNPEPGPQRLLHWDRLDWGTFRNDDSYLHESAFITFPPWFPYFVFTALLWPLYSRAGEREKKLRQV